MTQSEYSKLELRMRGICQRLEAIESKCGCKVKFKESVDDRLNELEKTVVFQGRQAMEIYSKLNAHVEKPVTDEIVKRGVQLGGVIDDGKHLQKDERPSVCDTCHDWERHLKQYCQECNKPSDFIQISRRVAEECLRQTGLVLPNELHDELKRGVER